MSEEKEFLRLMILLAAWSKYGGTDVLARRVSDLGNIVADGFWWLEEICEESWGRNWSDLRTRRSQHFFLNKHPFLQSFTYSWDTSIHHVNMVTLHGLPPDSASYSFVFQCSYIGTKLPACALSEHKPYQTSAPREPFCLSVCLFVFIFFLFLQPLILATVIYQLCSFSRCTSCLSAIGKQFVGRTSILTIPVFF